MNDSKNNLQIVTGLTRPNHAWLNSKTKQSVILICDQSMSILGQKADDISLGRQDFVEELAKPTNKDAFFVGVIDFNDKATITHDLTKATELAGNLSSIRPDGNTNITEALEKAISLIDNQVQLIDENTIFLKPIALLFSDGCHNTGEAPYDSAKQLKQIADLVTVAYGNDADEEMLISLATTPQHFYRCRNGKELREFLPAIGETISTSLSTGVNTLDYLSQQSGKSSEEDSLNLE